MEQPSKPALKRLIKNLYQLGARLDDTGECAVALLNLTATMTPIESNAVIKYLLESLPSSVAEYLDGAVSEREVGRVQQSLASLHEAIGSVAAGMEDEQVRELKSLFPMRFTFKNEGLSGTDFSKTSVSDESFSARQLTTQDLLKKPKFNDDIQSYRSRDMLKATPLPALGSTDRVSGIGAISPLPTSARSQSRVIQMPSQEDLAPPPEEIAEDRRVPELVSYLIAATSLGITVYLFNHLMGFFRHNMLWQLAVPFISGAVVMLRYAFKYNLTYLKIGIGLFILIYGGYVGITKRQEIMDLAVIESRTIVAKDRMRKLSSALKRYYSERGEMPRNLSQLLEPNARRIYFDAGVDPEQIVVDPFADDNGWFYFHRTRDHFIIQSVGPQNHARYISIDSMVREQAPLWEQLMPLTYDPLNGTYSTGNFFLTSRE